MSTTEENKEEIRRIQKELADDYKKKYQHVVGTCLKQRGHKIDKVTDIIYADDHCYGDSTVRYKCISLKFDFRSQGMDEKEGKLNYEINTNGFGTIEDYMLGYFTVSEEVFQSMLQYCITKINEQAAAKEAQQ